MVAPGKWPQTDEELQAAKDEFEKDEKKVKLLDALDQKVIDDSKKIEDATHAYVRKHLAVFERLD